MNAKEGRLNPNTPNGRPRVGSVLLFKHVRSEATNICTNSHSVITVYFGSLPMEPAIDAKKTGAKRNLRC